MTRHAETNDKQPMLKPLISEAEMALLLTPRERSLLKGTDPGFKLRNRFLTAIVLFFVTKLMFFSEQTTLDLQLPFNMNDLRPYFQYRGFFVFLASCVYVLSYIRDWHFERVGLFICGISCTGLVMDFFNVYSWIQGPMSAYVMALIFLRIAAIYLLSMNVIRANRAPPLPRSFWR